MKLTPRTAGLVISSSPTSFTCAREQGTTLNTPFGSPASAITSAIRRPPETGVSSDGFRTIVFPTARAMAKPREDKVSGKFQGVITETTPNGSRTTMLTLPCSDGRISPAT